MTTDPGVDGETFTKLELIVNPEWKLYQALKANDPRRVEDALARGADPNARDPDGRTPLYEAVLSRKDRIRCYSRAEDNPIEASPAFLPVRIVDQEPSTPQSQPPPPIEIV